MWFNKLFILLSVCVKFSIEAESSSHWVVTESGLIQPRLNSPFDMARPYDLLAFLNQEKRWNDIFDIYNDLMKQQMTIESIKVEIAKISEIQNSQDDECKKMNTKAIDLNTVFLDDGSSKVPRKNFRYPMDYLGPNFDVPDCKRISSLTFSMFAFEHLESMMQRHSLVASPENKMPEVLSYVTTMDQFGHWVTGQLRQNSTSWLHYHMASVFWRIRGNAPKAMECSRRAVLHAPRQYKDIALGSLGMVLHRSGKRNDSIIVLTAAIDHDPNNYACHYAIANAYTAIGELDTSLKHYNNSIRLHPNLELAGIHMFGVLCYIKLNGSIRAIRESLDRLDQVLHEYNQKEEAWHKVLAEFLKTIKNSEEFEYRTIEDTYKRIEEITGINMKEFKSQSEKTPLIEYSFFKYSYGDEKPKKKRTIINALLSYERLKQHVGNYPHFDDSIVENDLPLDVTDSEHSREGTEQITAKTPSEDNTESRFTNVKKLASNKEAEVKLSEFETEIYMYPPTMKINRNKEDFDKENDWPTTKFCTEAAASFPARFYYIVPVFLPFESRGVRIKSLLTEKLGVPLSEEYALPWHPPTCPHDKKIADLLAQKKLSKQQKVIDVLDTGYLRQKLLEYVSDGNIESAMHMQDAEIGHRIYVAMQEELAPKWILATLASLYWRVRGNNVNALHCLQISSRSIKPLYVDIVLVSTASIHLEMGHIFEAYEAAEESLMLNPYEPATNFVIAELNMFMKNYVPLLFHMKQVIRVEPGFMNGLARNLLNIWACIIKQTQEVTIIENLEVGEICIDMKPIVENMVCEKTSKKCPLSNVPCYDNLKKGLFTRLFSSLKEGIEKMVNGDKTVKDEMVKVDIMVKDDKILNDDEMVKDDKMVEDDEMVKDDKMVEDDDVNKEDENDDDKYKIEMDKVDEDDAPQHDYVDDHFLLHFKMHVSKNYSDRLGPNMFDYIAFKSLYKKCDSSGCKMHGYVNSEDLHLMAEDCKYSYLHLAYWAHVVGFRKLLTESKLQLPSRIVTMIPSSKLFPDCQGSVSPEDSYYLDRLSKIRNEGWEPLPILMRQFSEMFDFFDFNDLGAKITKYVDTRQHSWLGALAAGWWCGVGGKGPCAIKCLSVAYEYAPEKYKHLPLNLLSGLLQMHKNKKEAKDVAFLSFNAAPNSKTARMMVALSHSYLEEYEQALWMYRFSLMIDKNFFPSKACLHATLCIMHYQLPTKIE